MLIAIISMITAGLLLGLAAIVSTIMVKLITWGGNVECAPVQKTSYNRLFSLRHN